jgi:hypothetical protein
VPTALLKALCIDQRKQFPVIALYGKAGIEIDPSSRNLFSGINW